MRGHESALSGLKKNTAQIETLFAPGHLWTARRHYGVGAAG